jgi:hypothetical protein
LFKLSEIELQNGFEAIEHHGYSALLPMPPEWSVLRDQWSDIKTEIAAIDLDTYAPTPPLRIYAPKNRATVRVVSLLHPVDLIIYTSLTLIVLSYLEANRIPVRKKNVFSYRADTSSSNRLYQTDTAFAMFQARLNERSNRARVGYVGVADIADFYPRIYQHRLENVIESCSTTQRGRDVARVLAKKLIANLSGSNSYGIPVGPYASRVLAEAVLIDVDSYLISERLDFVRWVDDYYFFTRTEEQAQEILISLAQRLYETHGLTLSALKTKIQTKETFRRRFERNPDEQVDTRLQRVNEFSSRFDPYSEEEIELSEEERVELAGLNIEELIEESIRDHELVDYETLSSLLRHPELLSVLPLAARKNLGEVLLRNIVHLYPIAGSVAEFFGTFADLPSADRRRIQARLLSSLLPRHGKWPPDYYIIWILSVFADVDRWAQSPAFVRILRDHRSEIVRRSAALAIARNGTRADAVEAKSRFGSSSPLEQLAILLAAVKLGHDERRHWKRSLQLTGPLEKKI